MACKSISEVVEKNLCCGCGGCIVAAPEKIEMLDVTSDGLRPNIKVPLTSSEEALALELCPGVSIDYEHSFPRESMNREYLGEWGPILSVCEGHAADKEVRYKSSSGGVITALSIFGVEKKMQTVCYRLVLGAIILM